MQTWVVNLLSSLVGIGVLVLAHYGFVPTDIAGIIAGAMMYQVGGQAYHYTATKNSSTGSLPTIVTNGSSDTVPTNSIPVAPVVTPEHPSAKGV